MTILFKQLDIAYAVVTRAGLEHVAKRQRRKRGVAAGASAANDQPVAVSFAALDQIARAVHAIIYVDHAPLAVESTAIVGAVAGAPTIVHIQHAEAATRPVLNREFE